MDNIDLTRINDYVDDAIGDVVFIHGLGGDPKTTWTFVDTAGKRESKQYVSSFFPSVLSSDFPKINFWTLDYSAHVTEWAENPRYNELPRVSNEILEYLVGKGICEKPFMLVCHSLGGIVAKLILMKSVSSKSERLKRFSKKLRAISFLATPHKGSKWADIFNSVNKVLPFIKLTDRITELEFDNVALEELSKWYRENISDLNVETQAFYEQKKTGGIFVVEHISANPDVLGCDPIPVNSNHIEICKPSSKGSPVYVSISSLIKYHLLDQPSISDGLRPETIVIGVVRRDNEVLMVRRRHFIDGLTWQFVAGRLRSGENEYECVIREIKEETNINAKITEKLGIERGGSAPNIRIYIACEYLGGELKNCDVDENTEVSWVAIKDVRRFVTSSISKPVRKYLDI